jgi:hypothetical protein
MTVHAAVQVLFNRYITTGPTGAVVTLERTSASSRWGWGIDMGIIGGQEEYGGSTSRWQQGGWVTNTYTYRSSMRMINMDVRANVRLTPAPRLYSLTLGGGMGMAFVDYQYPRKVLLTSGIIDEIDERRLRQFVPLIATCIDNKLHITENIHLSFRLHFRWGLLRSPTIVIESINTLPGGYSRGINTLDDQERWHGFSIGGGVRF